MGKAKSTNNFTQDNSKYWGIFTFLYFHACLNYLKKQRGEKKKSKGGGKLELMYLRIYSCSKNKTETNIA